MDRQKEAKEDIDEEMNKKPPCSLPVVAREHDVSCCTNDRNPECRLHQPY